MSRSGLARFIRLGQQADPIILDALKHGAPSDFRPALSYHFEVAGKRMRAAMVVLSCGAAGGRVERAVKPAAVVEVIHNYSLVMDDLIDRGEVRRGRATVRVVMGDSIALLVAMFYREVLDDLIANSPASEEVRKTAVKTMKEIIDGERLDLLLEQAGRTDPYLVKSRDPRCKCSGRFRVEGSTRLPSNGRRLGYLRGEDGETTGQGHHRTQIGKRRNSGGAKIPISERPRRVEEDNWI